MAHKLKLYFHAYVFMADNFYRNFPAFQLKLAIVSKDMTRVEITLRFTLYMEKKAQEISGIQCF